MNLNQITLIMQVVMSLQSCAHARTSKLLPVKCYLISVANASVKNRSHLGDIDFYISH
jgi:hypothetical protein